MSGRAASSASLRFIAGSASPASTSRAFNKGDGFSRLPMTSILPLAGSHDRADPKTAGRLLEMGIVRSGQLQLRSREEKRPWRTQAR